MTLPFLTFGQLKDQQGNVLAASLPCSVWPTSGRNESAGRAYDHQGEASIIQSEALRGMNRLLIIDGVTYRIVEAIEHTFVPHVELLLRRMTGGSA